jgi:beta-N-acetylhexosaminidase
MVDLDRISNAVGIPANVALGQQIADDAVTLVRNNNSLLPLEKTGTVQAGLPYQRSEEASGRVVVVIFSEDVRTASGRTLEREMRQRIPDATVIYVDPRIATAMADSVLKSVQQAESVVAAIYMVPTAGKIAKAQNGEITNSVALENSSGLLLQSILDNAASKTIVVAAGNPYVAQAFPAIQNYVCTFSDESVSEISAVKALFGEIAIHGRLPVSIPGFALRGTGIDRAISESNARSSE